VCVCACELVCVCVWEHTHTSTHTPHTHATHHTHADGTVVEAGERIWWKISGIHSSPPSLSRFLAAVPCLRYSLVQGIKAFSLPYLALALSLSRSLALLLSCLLTLSLFRSLALSLSRCFSTPNQLQGILRDMLRKEACNIATR